MKSGRGIFIGLVVCNLIWSAHPAMSKLALAELGPWITAWLRYAGALAAFAIFAASTGRDGFFRPRGKREWLLAFGLGASSYCFAPILQLSGLQSSRATENALIIAIEPLMTVLVARIFLREVVSLSSYIAFSVSIAGFLLLSGFRWSDLGGGWDPHFAGNMLMLISLLGEASYSTFARKLLERRSPISIFGTGMALGVAALTASVLVLLQFSGASLGVHEVTWRSAVAVLWLGPLGTAAAYLYWTVALTRAPVASLALTLFVQPVFGSLWGFLFLNEKLSIVQLLGGLLILLAVFAQIVVTNFWRRTR